MTMPNVLKVVPDRHNKITLLVSQPDKAVEWFQGSFKSTKGWVSAYVPSNVAPSYWYHSLPSNDIVDFLLRQNFQSDDELIIGESDFAKISKIISAPIVDFSLRDIRLVKKMKSVRNQHAVLIAEPCSYNDKWSICFREGGGYFSGAFPESAEETLRYLRSHTKQVPVFMTESALELLQPALALPTLPVQVALCPELPEQVYTPRKPMFIQSLSLFLRWNANQ